MRNKRSGIFKVFACFFLLTISFCCVSCVGTENERHPFVSGSFYPADKSTLSAMIDDFLSKVPDQAKPEGEIVALISPHAGYIYSGQTAAYGYKLIEGLKFDTVILLGVYHKAGFPGASLWRSGDWETPLGTVPIDKELADALYKENKSFWFTQDAHLTEHSLEVQVPFLQKVLKNFKIVPILMSRPSMKDSRFLAQAIAKHIQGKKVLIIVSTDMSHYYPDAEARIMDKETLGLLEKEDSEGLLMESSNGQVELCGIAATVAALETAKEIGNTKTKVLKYATSADATGDTSRVVGYGSLVIYKTGEKARPATKKADEAEALSGEQEKELIKIARQTLDSYIQNGQVPEFTVTDPVLKADRAVFVTLREFGDLRGCIGRLTPEEPLYLAVRNMTIESATRDPRFRPVGPRELKNIKIEISVLSLPKRIASADEIVMGKHGVIVKQGFSSGVFLPKVADETAWSKREFLNELCSQKAGLPPDCWNQAETELYVFTSHDFKE